MKQSRVAAIQKDLSKEGLEEDITVYKVTDHLAYRRLQGSRSGLNAVFGHWPGDESEAEILAALEEIS